jgi:hypothetical protein
MRPSAVRIWLRGIYRHVHDDHHHERCRAHRYSMHAEFVDRVVHDDESGQRPLLFLYGVRFGKSTKK